MDKKFYERSVRISKDNEISMTMVIFGVLAIIYLFGSSFLTSAISVTAMKIIVSLITMSLAWELAKNGIFQTLYQVIAFVIAVWFVGMAFDKAPSYIMNQDVNGWIQITDQLDQEYAGHVTIGEEGFGFNAQGNSGQTVYAEPAVEIPDSNQGGGVPNMIPTVAPQAVYGEPFVAQEVAATPAPTATPTTEQLLHNAQLEIQVAMVANDITTALSKAETTYATYGDDYSLSIMTSIQDARTRKEDRVAHFSVANASSTSFMVGGEEELNMELLSGNSWLVVSEGNSYGWFACQKNVVIEQKDGLLKGSQFVIKYCMLANVNGEGQVNSIFEVK